MTDSLLVARFEVFRAIRTWRAIALLLLYAVTTAGAAYLFAQAVLLAEINLATQLGVAATEVPGGMMNDLVKSEGYASVVSAMVGDETLAAQLRAVPLVALFHLWLGLLLVPFFAASASAESIAIDMNSRALRFEALRTGRMEIVFGRFLGQLAITGAASATSGLVMWAAIVGWMAVDDRLALLGWLGWYSVRTWFFAVPFVGFGVACSQWTTSAAWARVLAIGGTAGSWVGYLVLRWMEHEGHLPWATDLLLQLLPQGWIRGLWEPGTGWILSCAATAGLGIAALMLGFVRFARRDL